MISLEWRLKASALAMLGYLLTAALCSTGGTPEHLLSDEALLRDWRRDVLVVTIKSVHDKGATNGKPPRVTFVIDEVLRGEAKAGQNSRQFGTRSRTTSTPRDGVTSWRLGRRDR